MTYAVLWYSTVSVSDLQVQIVPTDAAAEQGRTEFGKPRSTLKLLFILYIQRHRTGNCSGDLKNCVAVRTFVTGDCVIGSMCLYNWNWIKSTVVKTTVVMRQPLPRLYAGAERVCGIKRHR